MLKLQPVSAFSQLEAGAYLISSLDKVKTSHLFYKTTTLYDCIGFGTIFEVQPLWKGWTSSSDLLPMAVRYEQTSATHLAFPRF